MLPTTITAAPFGPGHRLLAHDRHHPGHRRRWFVLHHHPAHRDHLLVTPRPPTGGASHFAPSRTRPGLASAPVVHQTARRSGAPDSSPARPVYHRPAAVQDPGRRHHHGRRPGDRRARLSTYADARARASPHLAVLRSPCTPTIRRRGMTTGGSLGKRTGLSRRAQRDPLPCRHDRGNLPARRGRKAPMQADKRKSDHNDRTGPGAPSGSWSELPAAGPAHLQRLGGLPGQLECRDTGYRRARRARNQHSHGVEGVKPEDGAVMNSRPVLRRQAYKEGTWSGQPAPGPARASRTWRADRYDPPWKQNSWYAVPPVLNSG